MGLLVVCLWVCLPADASRAGEQEDTTRLDRILQQMDSTYKGLRTYRAEFEQVSETKTFQRKTHASGRVYFSKPSEMRWRYLEPEKREVYLSGERLHIYVPGRNQVIKQTLDDAMPGLAPARLFMGVEELRGSFSITLEDEEGKEEEAYCLRLNPKKKGTISVEEILLWVGQEDFLPVRTESRDVLGNRTTLLFKKAEVNVPLKAELFRFEVPADAEVLENPF